MFQRIPKYLRNKYTITTLAFVVWILFLDSFDVFTLQRNLSKLEQKRQEKARYEAEIAKTKQALHELSSDPKMLEKFARENYLMKRADEDVFVIVEQAEEAE